MCIYTHFKVFWHSVFKHAVELVIPIGMKAFRGLVCSEESSHLKMSNQAKNCKEEEKTSLDTTLEISISCS